MEYPKYYGNYTGIIVQNNDPQYRGRVKVFVPHITPTVYKNWTENSDKTPAVDRVFKFIGNNVGSDLTAIIEDLKLVLPWAEIASPLAGEATSGRYHAASKRATTSDSSNYNYLFATSGTAASAAPFALNLDVIGEKAGTVFDSATVNLSDAFNNPQLTNVNNVNKLSYNYTPEIYSNSAKGAFAIPNVGAHVWVFFHEGDPLKPVVFGVSHGAAEWNSIYDATPGQPGLDYPGEFENSPTSSDSINAETYRNKYVINQKGGTLAFVNTDNNETLKMTHYSGSFKEFNNQASVELATNNDQKLVLGDMFETIRGTRNEFTQRDFDSIVAGDYYRKVGDLNVALYKQWKAIMDPIADIKQLFDIRRTDGAHESVAKFLKLNGSGQARTGNPSPCPVCAGGSTTLAINNSFQPGYRAHANAAQASVINGDLVGKKNLFDVPQWGRGIDLRSASALTSFTSNINSSVSNIQSQVTNTVNGLKSVTKSPSSLLQSAGQSILGGALQNLITGNISGLLGTKFLTNIVQNFTASVPTAIIPGITEIVGTDGKPLPNRPGYPVGHPCPACNGTGISPSSFNGVWAYETKKVVELPQMMLTTIPQLAKIEAQMGRGGSEILEITKHKIETIGTVMNDWGAIRIDPLGKMEPAYVTVHPGASLVIRKPSPLIEQVQVDDLPGGTYTLNVCNRYNILVGAGGVNLKSYGVVNISGAMTNIAGEQVNIGSANEVNIDGGKRLSLTGDIVHIKQRNNEQVLLDGNVGISGNLYVKGGVYVEGNLAAQGTDTPQRKRQTDPISTSGGPVPDFCTGVSIPVDEGGKIRDQTTRELLPGGGSKLYMGYADENRTIGVLPIGVYVGDMPSNTTFKMFIPAIPVVGVSASGESVTGNTIAGTYQVRCLDDLPIIAKSNVKGYQGNASPGTKPKKLKEISSEAAQLLGSTDAGAYSLGSHKGSKQENLPLRGLPPPSVKILIDATKTPFSGGAIQFPVMNMGTGAHADSHIMAAHTHSYDEGENGSHMAIRQGAMVSLTPSNNDFEDITTATQIT